MDIVSIAIGVVVKNDVKVTGVVEVWTTVEVSTLVEVWCDFEVTLATRVSFTVEVTVLRIVVLSTFVGEAARTRLSSPSHWHRSVVCWQSDVFAIEPYTKEKVP